MVTESVRHDAPDLVSQFMTIVSVEPLIELLADNGLFPESIHPEIAEIYRRPAG